MSQETMQSEQEVEEALARHHRKFVRLAHPADAHIANDASVLAAALVRCREENAELSALKDYNRGNLERAEKAEARAKDFEAKWYQSNRDLHAAWASAKQWRESCENNAVNMSKAQDGARAAESRLSAAEKVVEAAKHEVELHRDGIGHDCLLRLEESLAALSGGQNGA